MKRFAVAIIAVACVAAIWLFVEFSDNRSTDLSGYGLLFPELLENINDIDEIVVAAAGDRLTLIRQDGIWLLKESDYYPAQMQMIQSLLVALSQTRKIDPITQDADHFHALGVAGGDAADSPTIRVTLFVENHTVLGDVHIGNARVSNRNASVREYFARSFDESQVWLIQSNLNIPLAPQAWLNTEIADINEDRVGSVAIRAPGGDSIAVEKDSAPDSEFELQSRPERSRVAYRFRINQIGRIFSRLNFEDVQRKSLWHSDTVVTLATNDGLQVVAEMGSGALEQYTSISAQASQYAPQRIHEEAAALNDRHQGWVYRLSDARNEIIRYQMHDLVDYLPVPGAEQSILSTPQQ